MITIPDVPHKQQFEGGNIKSLNKLLVELGGEHRRPVVELAWLSPVQSANFEDLSDDDDENNEDCEHNQLCDCKESDGGVTI